MLTFQQRQWKETMPGVRRSECGEGVVVDTRNSVTPNNTQAHFVMPHYEGSSPQLLKPRQLSQAGFKACDYMLLILLIRPPEKDIRRPLIR